MAVESSEPSAEANLGPTIAIEHPRFRRIEIDMFTRMVAEDCMTHDCTMVETHKLKHDACCQYGCDVDVGERDAILAKAGDIKPLLRDAVKDLPWFTGEEVVDPDYPSGKVVRSAVFDDGCLFLQHDLRGCAIHRASIEKNWDFNGVKPNICRLFPLTYWDDTLAVADEYPDYSCAHGGGVSLYRFARTDLGAIFGADLIAAMDLAEAKILSKRLAVVS
jgi:Fe-S-cluster containining protein